MIQDGGDKRWGSFCFRGKDDIRAIGSDQNPELLNCSWMSNPSAVPRKYLHLLLGDTTWSLNLMELSKSNSAKLVRVAETEDLFRFLEALKKDLAGRGIEALQKN